MNVAAEPRLPSFTNLRDMLSILPATFVVMAVVVIARNGTALSDSWWPIVLLVVFLPLLLLQVRSIGRRWRSAGGSA